MTSVRQGCKLGLVLMAGLAVSASYRPVYRLSSEVPPGLTLRGGREVRTSVRDQDTARLYWQCAVRSLQCEYGYGFVLPEAPPAEFSLGMQDLRTGSGEAAVRAQYWQKVRELWQVPEVWNRQYEWSLDWVAEDIHRGSGWVQEQVAGIVNLSQRT